MATAVKAVKARTPKGVVVGAIALAKLVEKLPAARLYLDYDQEADVLYVSLKRPQRATHTVALDDEGILLDYRDKELVGLAVLEASKR